MCYSYMVGWCVRSVYYGSQLTYQMDYVTAQLFPTKLDKV